MDKKVFENLKYEVEHNKDYDFIRTNPNLGKNIIMLGLGGSYAYGTNNEGSDIDVRGVALNSAYNISVMQDFEQVVDNGTTDTCIYSFDKMMKLLAENNPNTIEVLGLDDDQIFYSTPIWQEIVANKDMFLSKRVIKTFGGYANAQLRRLENTTIRVAEQKRKEQHILNSIEHASVDFKTRYSRIEDDKLKLYLDDSMHDDMDKEIYVDINLSHYPLRDLADIVNDYHSVIRGYDKIGKRNKNAIENKKLGKHMMHLIRLYYMCFDILENGEVRTYREKEHDELMEIRNGKYLDDNQQVIPAFYEYIDDLENRLKVAGEKTMLPEVPDFDKIEKFRSHINMQILENA